MTIYSLQRLAEILEEKLENAKAAAKESHSVAMNSYGAGYDRGYLDALEEIWSEIPEEEKLND